MTSDGAWPEAPTPHPSHAAQSANRTVWVNMQLFKVPSMNITIILGKVYYHIQMHTSDMLMSRVNCILTEETHSALATELHELQDLKNVALCYRISPFFFKLFIKLNMYVVSEFRA